jgi:hypothetical protein
MLKMAIVLRIIAAEREGTENRLVVQCLPPFELVEDLLAGVGLQYNRIDRRTYLER